MSLSFGINVRTFDNPFSPLTPWTSVLSVSGYSSNGHYVLEPTFDGLTLWGTCAWPKVEFGVTAMVWTNDNYNPQFLGSSDFGLSGEVTVPTVVGTPTNLVATSQPDGTTTLTWDAVTGAEYYRIIETNSTSPEAGAIDYVSGLSYNAALSPQASYAVQACKNESVSGGTEMRSSLYSNFVGGGLVPIAPTWLVAYLTGGDSSTSQITSLWNNTPDNETGYELQYSTDTGGSWNALAGTGEDVTQSMTDIGLPSNIALAQVMVRVRSLGPGGSSAWAVAALVAAPIRLSLICGYTVSTIKVGYGTTGSTVVAVSEIYKGTSTPYAVSGDIIASVFFGTTSIGTGFTIGDTYDPVTEKHNINISVDTSSIPGYSSGMELNIKLTSSKDPTAITWLTLIIR